MMNLNFFHQDVNSYQVPVLNLIEFLDILATSGKLTQELVTDLMTLFSNIEYLKSQFILTDYNRILISTTLTVEGDETFEFLEMLQDLIDKYFSNSHIVSESLNSYELHEVFSNDKLIVNGLSALFIAIILLCTFNCYCYDFLYTNCNKP